MGAGSRIILIEADPAAARWGKVAVEITIASTALHDVQDPIRHRIRRSIEMAVDVDSGRACRGTYRAGRAGSGADGKRALVVMLVAVENHVDAVIFQEPGNGAHLVVHDGGIAGRKRRLVIDDDLPELGAGIEIVDHPVGQGRRIRSEYRR